MIKDYKKYEVIQNKGLGICHILDKCDKGYLVYSEENSEHFIVCDSILEDGYLYQTNYYSDLESALKLFKSLQKEKSL